MPNDANFEAAGLAAGMQSDEHGVSRFDILNATPAYHTDGYNALCHCSTEAQVVNHSDNRAQGDAAMACAA